MKIRWIDAYQPARAHLDKCQIELRKYHYLFAVAVKRHRHISGLSAKGENRMQVPCPACSSVSESVGWGWEHLALKKSVRVSFSEAWAHVRVYCLSSSLMKLRFQKEVPILQAACLEGRQSQHLKEELELASWTWGGGGPRQSKQQVQKQKFRRVSGLGDVNGKREGGSLKMPLWLDSGLFQTWAVTKSMSIKVFL